MKRSPAVIASLIMALPLAACGTDSADDNAIKVVAKDDVCKVGVTETESGTRTFQITNDGGAVTKFSVLADDGLRVVAEREDIAPGDTAELVVQLEPGEYFTACKPGLRGPNVGQAAFRVNGEAVDSGESDQKRLKQARDNYISFVKNETAELLPATEEFAEAYASGNDALAKELYSTARVHYKRIEPVAETFGVLESRIDGREVDYNAEADKWKKEDPTFTEWLGFHRIEKDLWPPAEGDENVDGSPAQQGWEPSSPEKRREIADALIGDVEQLNMTVSDQSFFDDDDITLDTVANGALGRLEEMATKKATGEENWWSHTDLYDVAASVEGTRVVFDAVKDIAAQRGDEAEALVGDITTRYDDIEELLARYGSLETGFPYYDTIDAGKQAELARAIDALREPLTRLTGTELGLDV